MQDTENLSGTSKTLLSLIAILLMGYVAAWIVGLPQNGADMIVAAEGLETQSAPAAETVVSLPLWTVLPFVLLLGLIAVMPLVPRVAHWWESNRNKIAISGLLTLATLGYFLLFHDSPIEAAWPAAHTANPGPGGVNLAVASGVFLDAVMGQYVPFLILLLSLYTISGGIRLTGDLPAHPGTNTAFLACGGLLASVIGTTGASMLLIRPLLDTNSERKHVKHTVVFFIFIACNCGGCLLPTGDPPLFLGYLLGVPFLWTLSLWKPWLFINVSLLIIYYIWDRFVCYPREELADISRDETEVTALRIWGVWPNGILLMAVVLAAGLLDPSRPLAGTDWHPWLYLRECALLVLVALSLVFGRESIRKANGFNYAAIGEVAALFLGIFVCMQPALMILSSQGPTLGLTTPAHYFWASGSLSSFLDNAPTYVVFFNGAKAYTQSALPNLAPGELVAGVQATLLAAVSMGSVFMGANTYIGNGPNFMVKSIAENAGVKMPSFFGYMVYSGLILIPLFLLATLIFLV